MPAVGIEVTDGNNTPLSIPIEIDLPNNDENITNTCQNLSGLLSMNFKLQVDSQDTAWVIEITDGLVTLFD